jgi:tRNA G10  N-methylase Trm11
VEFFAYFGEKRYNEMVDVKFMKKKEYYFILGRNPALSFAEIKAVLKIGDKTQNNAEIISFCENFLIVELNDNIDAKQLMGVLGGTIKIGVVVKERNFNVQLVTDQTPRLRQSPFAEFGAEDLIAGLNIDKEKKFYFGFSVYGKFNNKINIKIKRLAMGVKKELKEKGISSRWVSSKEDQLSSVIVKKNKLAGENGVEWCVLKNKDKTFLGKTLAVQEFEDYGKRDFERPKRDVRSGMLPPKLAKIMINLARFELGSKINGAITLLDPFCGSGTILQEAAILGIDKIIGSDLSEKAIKDAKQNLKWLGEKLNLKINAKMHQTDVKKLSNLILKNSVDLIVTEPYLGPPLVGGENDKMIDAIIKELSELYLFAFEEFKKVLKKGGVVCAVFPVFAQFRSAGRRDGGRSGKFLPIFEKVKKTGFTPVCFSDINNCEIDKKNPAKNLSERKTIVYGRDGQKVLREIVVFKL